MKIIETNIKDKFCIFEWCGCCDSKLEVTEEDIRCNYTDNYTSSFFYIKHEVNFYCVCAACNYNIKLYSLPDTIMQRVQNKYPKPEKKNWFEKLFNL